jgi:Mannosyltransferase (PIG-V)
MSEETEPPPASRRDYWLLALPLLIYAASRIVQLWLVAWMLPAGSQGGVRGRLLSWDGGWFVRVAEEGYPHGYTYDESGTLVGNGLAFFPGYPTLVRLVHFATGLGYETAALTVSWLSGAVAAALVCVLGARLYNRRTGLVLTVLFCAQPMSLALSMAYSEALFTALVAGMLLAAHRNAWLVAGVLGLAAALTRPTGAAAAIALAVGAVMALRNGTTSKWRPVVAAVVALAGVPAYLFWVGERVGSLGAWFDIQTAGWGTTFDYGLSTWRFLVDSFRAGEGWIQVSIAWMVLGVVALAFIAIYQRVWLPLLTYGLIALVLVLGQGGYYHSKPRLLVPVLLILVPVAVALGRARTGTAALVLLGYSAFGLWYGAYLVTVWHYAI